MFPTPTTTLESIITRLIDAERPLQDDAKPATVNADESGSGPNLRSKTGLEGRPAEDGRDVPDRRGS